MVCLIILINENNKKKMFLKFSDGSILLQFEEVIGADLNEVVDEHFLETLKTKLTENFGELKFIKFINEMIWVAFNNYEKAIDASEQGSLEICGHNMTIRLRNLAWRQTLGTVTET